MAVLSEADRVEVAALIMRELSADREPCPFVKATVRAAVDACDSWQNDNAAAFNAALPAAFRNNASAAQKSRLFRLVSRFRYEKGA
jgi:hypothetical protein